MIQITIVIADEYLNLPTLSFFFILQWFILILCVKRIYKLKLTVENIYDKWFEKIKKGNFLFN